MTLLDFELHMRPAKVAKAKLMWQKGQVLDLHEAAVMYVAKMKIGAYKTQIALDGLNLSSSRCNCDAQRTRFCEHSVAVLFAVREAAGLKPILASTIPKLNYAGGPLNAMLKVFNEPDASISKADTALFSKTAKQLTQDMQVAFENKQYEQAATLGMSIATAVQEMELYLNHNYRECEAITAPVFSLLEKTIPYVDHLFHDVRIESVRRYNTVNDANKNWFDVLLAGASDATKQDQYIRTMNALCILVDGSVQESSVPFYTKIFLKYRDRLAFSGNNG